MTGKTIYMYDSDCNSVSITGMYCNVIVYIGLTGSLRLVSKTNVSEVGVDPSTQLSVTLGKTE